jgi:FtsX-like permease family
MRIPALLSLAAAAAIAATRPAPVQAQSPPPARDAPDFRLQADEPNTALAIIRLRTSGESSSTDDWRRLFASQGYQHRSEREASMRRPFTDSSFTQFVTSDTLVARYAALARTVEALKRVDVSAAAARAMAYLAQSPAAEMTLVVRTACDARGRNACNDVAPRALEIRRIVTETDPSVSAYAVEAMSDVVGQSLSGRRVGATLSLVLALLALLLASAGIYGLMVLHLALGRRDVGIRPALGAQPREVRRRLLGEALRLAAIGAAVGLAITALGGRGDGEHVVRRDADQSADAVDGGGGGGHGQRRCAGELGAGGARCAHLAGECVAIGVSVKSAQFYPAIMCNLKPAPRLSRSAAPLGDHPAYGVHDRHWLLELNVVP